MNKLTKSDVMEMLTTRVRSPNESPYCKYGDWEMDILTDPSTGEVRGGMISTQSLETFDGNLGQKNRIVCIINRVHLDEYALSFFTQMKFEGNLGKRQKGMVRVGKESAIVVLFEISKNSNGMTVCKMLNYTVNDLLDSLKTAERGGERFQVEIEIQSAGHKQTATFSTNGFTDILEFYDKNIKNQRDKN